MGEFEAPWQALADHPGGSLVNAVLLTRGDPDATTGGALYHRRIVDRSPAFGVHLEIRPLERGEDARDAAGEAEVVVVDSIVASRVRPEALARPVLASAHQRPGGLTGRAGARAVRAALDRRCYLRATRVVVPSEFLASELARAGVPAPRLHVVPPGRAVPEFALRATRSAAGRAPAAVASVANLSVHKRPLDLLEAFAKLGDLDVSLTLIGHGTNPRLADRVRRRLARPDLAGRARWLGPLPPAAVAKELAAADVFALPALHESYGMAVAEAMTAGMPAVVARSGNLPNLVRDGIDGLVVPPRDVAVLSAAMRRLVRDASLRRTMGAAARSRAAGFPSWDETAERFCAVVRAAHSPAGVPGMRGPTSAV
jgi:glycosyltransferase involved in cell wall biosynthesis